MTVHDRIKLAVKWLIGTGIANNQEAIGRCMGYSNKSSFSQILNNKVPIPGDFIERLCALNSDINKVWVENETGDMLHTDNIPITSVSDKETVKSDVVILRLMDKLDEKDSLLKEKDSKIDYLQSELLQKSEKLAAALAQIEKYEQEDKRQTGVQHVKPASIEKSSLSKTAAAPSVDVQ